MTLNLKTKLAKIAIVLCLLTIPLAQSFGPLVNTAAADGCHDGWCPD